MSPDSMSDEMRVDAMQKQMVNQLWWINLTNLLTAIIGVVLLLVVTGYFTWGYYKLNDLLDPDTLAGAGTDLVMKNMKPTREKVEKMIIEQAPAAAEKLSKDVHDKMPEARIALEKIIEERTEEALKDSAKMSKDELRKFVKNNRKELKESIETMKNTNDSEKVLKSLIRVVDREFGAEVKKQSQDTFLTLMQVNEQLDRLKKGDTKAYKLTPAQVTMRRIIMICRRVIAEQPKLDGATTP